DDLVTVDALLVTVEHGLVILKLAETAPSNSDEVGWQAVKDDLDRLYIAVEASLSRYEELRRGRTLAVAPSTVGVFPTLNNGPTVDNYYFADMATLTSVIDALAGLDKDLYKPLQAALQRVSTIKP